MPTSPHLVETPDFRPELHPRNRLGRFRREVLDRLSPEVQAGGRDPRMDPDWEHPDWKEWDSPGNKQGLARVRAKLKRGERLTPRDFTFAACGAYCGEIAPALADGLHDLGVEAVSGYYGPNGYKGGFHVWLRLPDGTYVDTTHGQIKHDQPVVVLRPGDPEHSMYVTVDEILAMKDRQAYEKVNGPVDDAEWARLTGKPEPKAGAESRSLSPAQVKQIVQIRDSERRANNASLGLPPGTKGACHTVAPEVAAMLGGREQSGWRADQHEPVDHHWVELEDGTIIDPTADQFAEGDVPPDGIAIIPPDHPDRWRYREYADPKVPADEWDHDDPTFEQAFGIQEAFRPELHPRDRRGKFSAKGLLKFTLGVTPYRGAGQAKGDDYYLTSRYRGFENVIRGFEDLHPRIERVRGVWAGGGEPSARVTVQGAPRQVQAFMDHLGYRYNQDAVISFRGGDGPARMYLSDPAIDADLEALVAQVNEGRPEAEQIQGLSRRPDGRVEIIDTEARAGEAIVALFDALDVSFGYDTGNAELRFKGTHWPANPRGGSGQDGRAVEEASTRPPDEARGPPERRRKFADPRLQEAWEELQEVGFKPELHPRDRRGRWREVMYHLSPRANRASIDKEGLRLSDTKSKYLWLFKTRGEALHHAQKPWAGRREGNDVYAVDVTGMHVKPDPHPGFEGLPTYVIDKPVSPARVQRVTPASMAQPKWKRIVPVFHPPKGGAELDLKALTKRALEMGRDYNWDASFAKEDKSERFIHEHDITPASYVWEHGQAYEAPDEYNPNGYDIDFGPLGNCYQNALMAALENGLTYVEGYAVAQAGLTMPGATEGGGRAVAHAWVVDDEGVVIDPTWGVRMEPPRPGGAAYFGIPMPANVAAGLMTERGYYGLFYRTDEGDNELLDVPWPEVLADEEEALGVGAKAGTEALPTWSPNPDKLWARGLIDRDTGKLWVWPETKADTHEMAAQRLGVKRWAALNVSPEGTATYTYDNHTPESGPGLSAAEQATIAAAGLDVGVVRPSRRRFSFAPKAGTDTDYRGMHTAPGAEPGASMDNPKDIFPDDLYGPNGARYYGHRGGFEAEDARTIGILRSVRGKPDATIAVHRAVPSDTEGEVNPGDWVTPNPNYAKHHGESALYGNYRIASRKVRVGDLYTDGNSPHEWGWQPPPAPKAGTDTNPLDMKRDEYVNTLPRPAFMLDKGVDDWTEEESNEASAYFDQSRKLKREWDAAMKRAVALGEMEPMEAVRRGAGKSDWGRLRHDDGHVGEPGAMPLPKRMWHVTTALRSVLEHGLKTRDELGQISGAGLGGGTEDTISFTDDPKVAAVIHDSILEAGRVANGSMSIEDMLEKARKGDKGSRPFIRELLDSLGSKGPDGEYSKGLKDTLAGIRREISSGYPRTPEYWAEKSWEGSAYATRYNEVNQLIGKKGFTPDPESRWPHGDIEQYTEATRPKTDPEKADSRLDVYKTFLTWREQAGGPENPLFFGSDPVALATMDPANVGTVEVEPVNPNAKGYQVSALGEWRVHTGDAVRVVGARRQIDPTHVSQQAIRPENVSLVLAPKAGTDWSQIPESDFEHEPGVYYKVAPSAWRKSIEERGFIPGGREDLVSERQMEGVYIWDTLAAAKHWRDTTAKTWTRNTRGLNTDEHDIWRINLNEGDYIVPDEVQQWDHLGKAMVHPEGKIVPEKLSVFEALMEAHFNPDLHPRDRLGKWRNRFTVHRRDRTDLRDKTPDKPDLPISSHPTLESAQAAAERMRNARARAVGHRGFDYDYTVREKRSIPGGGAEVRHGGGPYEIAGKPAPKAGTERGTITYGEAHGLQTTTRVFAAFDYNGSLPIGALTVDEKHGTVELVGVEEEYRRQGIATKLLQVARQVTGLPLNKDTGLRSADGRKWAKHHGITADGQFKNWGQRDANAAYAGLMVGLFRSRDVTPVELKPPPKAGTETDPLEPVRQAIAAARESAKVELPVAQDGGTTIVSGRTEGGTEVRGGLVGYRIGAKFTAQHMEHLRNRAFVSGDLNYVQHLHAEVITTGDGGSHITFPSPTSAVKFLRTIPEDDRQLLLHGGVWAIVRGKDVPEIKLSRAKGGLIGEDPLEHDGKPMYNIESLGGSGLGSMRMAWHHKGWWFAYNPHFTLDTQQGIDRAYLEAVDAGLYAKTQKELKQILIKEHTRHPEYYVPEEYLEGIGTPDAEKVIEVGKRVREAAAPRIEEEVRKLWKRRVLEAQNGEHLGDEEPGYLNVTGRSGGVTLHAASLDPDNPLPVPLVYMRENVSGWVTRELLEELMPGYGQAEFKFRKREGGKGEMVAGEAWYLPKEWVEHSNQYGNLKVETTRANRSSYWSGTSTIKMSKWAGEATALHELAHHFEYLIDRSAIRAVTKEFHRRRTHGQDDVALYKLRPGSGYKRDERTIPDQFANPYTGKTAPTLPGIEVFSMGLEGVFYGTDNLISRDPEHWDLTVGLLLTAQP